MVDKGWRKAVIGTDSKKRMVLQAEGGVAEKVMPWKTEPQDLHTQSPTKAKTPPGEQESGTRVLSVEDARAQSSGFFRRSCLKGTKRCLPDEDTTKLLTKNC